MFDIKRFACDDSGAITVDWVVLTAAAVGMTLAMLTLIGQGLEHATGDIDANLNAPSVIVRMRDGFGYTPYDAAEYGTIMRSVSQLDTSDLDQMASYSNALNASLDDSSDAEIVGRAADLNGAVDIAYANAGTTRTTGTAYDDSELTRISTEMSYETLALADG